MEIKIGSKQILFVLHLLSWLLFVGVSIEAGGFITNTIRVYFFNPSIARNFWNHTNFEPLYNYDSVWFLIQTGLICIASVLKALLFYSIIKLFLDNKIDLDKPFNIAVNKFLFNLSYLCFGVGFFSNWAANHSKWLIQKGIKMPAIDAMKIDGGDVWLFMGVVLIIIAFIFKRGIEIQNENDLTI